jgi:BASS family bile acid:Na+ symporter
LGSKFNPISLLRNRNFILVLALVLGLLLGDGSQWTEELVLPVLAFVMMLSTTSISGTLFTSPRALLVPVIVGITLNYGVLGGLMLVLSRLNIFEESFRTGYVILAAVPPAVGIIPFTGFMEGDMDFSLIGSIAGYLGAFIFTPLILFSFLGLTSGFQFKLLITMVELIIIPLILSRVLVYTKVASKITSLRGPLINWSFFLVIYTVVGLNRGVFLNQPSTIAPLIIIAITTTFLLGILIEKICQTLHVVPGRVVSMVLLGTSKNAGFAAGLALTLFSKETAIASTVQTIFMLAFIIFLDLRKRLES